MDQIQSSSKTPAHQASSDDLAGSQAAAASAREKLMDELKHVIGEAETWLNDDQSDDQALPEAKARFEDALHTAKTDLLKLEDSMLAHARDAAQSARVYVRNNPWKSVGLGAALGVIVGMLVTRK